jgi:serine/threonine-protein kinase SRK2
MFLGHPNIIKILEVFEHEDHMCFVMEYAPNGDLLGYLKRKKKLSETEAKQFFY